MEIIPVINCIETSCVAERVAVAKEFSKWVHLDVSDSRFTFGKSWGDATAWRNIGGRIKAEIHLMVEEPEQAVEAWLEAGAKRLIIHLETITENSFAGIESATGKYGVELMLAAAPETPVEKLKPYFVKVSAFQILAVQPGPAGQKFLPLVLDKVKFLRRELPDATIEVDGGMNPETAKFAKEAGADIVAAASYIFGGSDPRAAYERLASV